MKTSQPVTQRRLAELLKWHRRHIGLYLRVATKAGVSLSYVGLIAGGQRQNAKITEALTGELERLLRAAPSRKSLRHRSDA
jgi:hypothetical protein